VVYFPCRHRFKLSDLEGGNPLSHLPTYSSRRITGTKLTEMGEMDGTNHVSFVFVFPCGAQERDRCMDGVHYDWNGNGQTGEPASGPLCVI
jgi:hypothetical protein